MEQLSYGAFSADLHQRQGERVPLQVSIVFGARDRSGRKPWPGLQKTEKLPDLIVRSSRNRSSRWSMREMNVCYEFANY